MSETKYYRQPPVTAQAVIPPAIETLRSIEIYNYFNKGQSWLTAIDSFSKIAMAYPIEAKTPAVAREGILYWCATYGVPEEIISDRGGAFDNSLIREESKILGITWRAEYPSPHQG